MNGTTIKITNDFHHTTARVRGNQQGETLLSASIVRRVRRDLCGIAGCTCGGALGQRGPQRHGASLLDIAAMPNGEVLLRIIPE